MHLAPFVQFKKREKQTVLLLVKPATLLKVKFLHRCFPRFLKCTNGIKSRNVSHYWSVFKNR